ncbi:MAG TPA: UDP-3-O-(3-hydroxymyristoyl)glucosamine N-acyltransferase [Candidatus Desulfaltia sp.]|nr:UDP-3-O-(3-hydroxymyristoyl)glucosamine N-acyltransferase [Candidatus Desulfaltia sp.]
MPETPKPSPGPGPLRTVEEVARLLGCRFEGDGKKVITGVAGLETAGAGDLVFLAAPKFRRLLEETKAAAAIIPPDESFRGIPVIFSENPHLTFIRAVELFFQPYRPEPGIHPTAVISPSARVGKDVAVGALTVIGDEAEIGDGTVIFPLVSIYPRVKIGEGCVIHSHVSVREDVRIGTRVILHSGAVIGSDGFGYLKLEDGTHKKIPQRGTVVIEDDVEIGANSAIDRAALGETVIRRGTKIDNLVQVAHNVEIGENAILAGQVGIAGSSRIGKNVVLAGQVGVADHVSVGDNVIAIAQTGIARDVPAGAVVAGTPELDVRDWRKASVLRPQLYDLVKDLKKLKARVEELEKALKKD